MTIEQAELAEPLLAKASEYLPQTAVAKVKAAYEFAATRHAGQIRRNGDPVITHPLHAAETIASLQLDAATIAGGAAARRAGGLRRQQRRDRASASGTKWR